MSLDVYLELPEGIDLGPGGWTEDQIWVREDGAMRQVSREEWDEAYPGREPVAARVPVDSRQVFTANITHNVSRMAREAGIYDPLWQPEEAGITKAGELVEPLRAGLERLKADPERFKAFNPANGWGDYDLLVRFSADYLAAAEIWPEAEVSVWR